MSMNYKELLEEQIKESDNFTRTNFGQQVGKDYPEIVKEVITSETVTALLLVDVVMVGLSGKNLAESLRGQNKPDFSDVILKNITTFTGPLSMLYWGIQIGRKLEKQDAQVSALEKMFGGEDGKN